MTITPVLQGNVNIWTNNLTTEVNFWRGYCKNWVENNEFRLHPETHPFLYADFFNDIVLDKDIIEVLDVGAGPLTYLGLVHPEKKINIIAIDALADEYNIILKELNINPIIRTIKLNAENLTTTFGENKFDVIWCANALDHTHNPETVLLNMINVVSPTGYIILQHANNEGLRNNYGGLHQWNIYINDDGDYIFSSKNESVNITQHYKEIINIKNYILTPDVHRVIITKKKV